MKKPLILALLITCNVYTLLPSSDEQVALIENAEMPDANEFAFEEAAVDFDELPTNIVIAPTKRSFSFKQIPFYAQLFFSSLFEQRLKPAYYAVVGFVTGAKN